MNRKLVTLVIQKNGITLVNTMYSPNGNQDDIVLVHCVGYSNNYSHQKKLV